MPRAGDTVAVPVIRVPLELGQGYGYYGNGFLDARASFIQGDDAYKSRYNSDRTKIVNELRGKINLLQRSNYKNFYFEEDTTENLMNEINKDYTKFKESFNPVQIVPASIPPQTPPLVNDPRSETRLRDYKKRLYMYSDQTSLPPNKPLPSVPQPPQLMPAAIVPAQANKSQSDVFKAWGNFTAERKSQPMEPRNTKVAWVPIIAKSDPQNPASVQRSWYSIPRASTLVLDTNNRPQSGRGYLTRTGETKVLKPNESVPSGYTSTNDLYVLISSVPK